MNQNINPKSLKGKDVFNRTLELMNKLTPLNESVINAALEFVKRAPNGLVYTIIRENHKYFIKSTDKTEFKVSDLDYIGGLKNKMSEAYSSYEEALKHLNMKFQQMNEFYGIKGGYNLFEQDSIEMDEEMDEQTGEKKYKLKIKSDNDAPVDDVPTPSVGGMGPEGEPTPEEPSISDIPLSPEGEEAPTGEEMPSAEELPTGEEMPEESPIEGDEEEVDDLDIEDDDEDPKKYIQKLTGRLGQKLRELSEVDPKLEKYVINSVISALHVDKMDKKDRMDVIRKFKKKKGMESMMKESYSMDEYYGMMSLEGPFNFEKIKGGFDENNIESHPKKHKPLKFKKFELDMDEKKEFPDLTGDGKVTFADILKGRGVKLKKKKSSDEQWQGLAARAAGAALGSYLANKSDSDESEDIKFHRVKDEGMDRKQRLKDALNRIRAKRDEKKRMEDMDEMDVTELFGGNRPQPGVADPDIDIDEPLVEPTPRVPDPFDPGHPDDLPMPGPKMEKDDDFESIIKKYTRKK